MIPPDHSVYTPGGSAYFNCFVTWSGDENISVQWLVNGALLEHLNLTDVETELVFADDGRNALGILSFVDLSVEYYNRTKITCAATSESSESVRIATGNSSLFAQGVS